MPQFKVIIEKSLGIFRGQHGPINPFSNFDIFSPDLRERFDCKEFIIEAESQSKVEWFFSEAKKEGIESVRGFRLRSIEEIAG